MTSLVWNIIEINGLIIGFFLIYLMIRDRLMFAQRRVVLIGLPIVAVSVVFIKSLIDFSGFGYSIPIVDLDAVVVGANLEENQFSGPAEIFSMRNLYVLGAIGFSGVFLYRLGSLANFFYRNRGEKTDCYRIYNVHGKASFSFFNRIQISPELTREDQDVVFEHEKMHADKWHSLDHMVMALFHILFWFNPVFFFIKREIINLHEFEVDAIMYGKHKVNYMKFLVNYVLKTDTSEYLLTSRFYNQLSLKKRIKTMKIKTKKRKGLLLIIPMIALVAGTVQCRKMDSDKETEPTEEIREKEYVEVDVNPEFKGGEEAMTMYIAENVTYPQAAMDNGIEGIVYVQFVVKSSGKITDCEVVASADPDLDAEALRVVRNMPDWTPGEVDGKKVAVRYTLPISFRLG